MKLGLCMHPEKWTDAHLKMARQLGCETVVAWVPFGAGDDYWHLEDGSLYVAMWDGSRLEHRAADGTLLEAYPFPMRKVTSAAVEGDRILVTTGNKHEDADAYFRQTAAGSVFEIRKG